MSLQTLIKAAGDYLGSEEQLAKAADPLLMARYRQEVDKAGVKLQEEITSARQTFDGTGSIHNILVAVDHSEQSSWAVQRAIQFAQHFDARISIVHVVDLSPVALPELAYYDMQAQRALIDAGIEVMHRQAALVPADLLADSLLREGNVPDQIVATARDIAADLVVIGTHARGVLGRFLLGSTAEAVVRHTRCPVLTVSHAPNVQPVPSTASQPLQQKVGVESPA